MKSKLFLLGAIVAVILSSCAAPKAKNYSAVEYRTIEPTQSVFTAPLIADLKVSKEKISYAERINVKVNTKTDAEIHAIAEKEKQIVINNAVKSNNADVLVAPIVEIQTDANMYLVISVTAYPASYQNYRNATPEDKWILEYKGEGKTTSAPKQEGGIFSLFKKK
jgi:hypothetical protein